MKKSMLSGWSSIPGGILFFGGLCIYVHSGSRAIALYCLLTQTEPSLIVQEKQMPPLVALVFSFWTRLP